MQSRKFHLLSGVLAVALLAAIPLFGPSKYVMHILILVLLNVVLGQSWNLLGGFAGQISFGHAAMYGIGAYTSTLLYLHLGLSPWIGMFFGGMLAAFYATLLGTITFRLRGPYFALATLATAEVVRLIAQNWDTFTGGDDGLSIHLEIAPRVVEYFIILAVVTAVISVIYFISVSRIGYYLSAIREDEEASRAIGIDVTRYKVITLAISAFFAGIGGSFFASYQLYFNPYVVLTVHTSLQMIFISIVGGMGTIIGPIIGAFLLVPIAEIFRVISPSANLLIYGLVIVLVMRFMPEGIAGLGKKLFKSERKTG
jgi:branched-chain amino acid transport system permease protein